MEPSSVAVITEERISYVPAYASAANEIHPVPSSPPHSHGNPPSAPQGKRRLASLDVFRGLTVALMILVDDAGGAFPEINHAPWTGVTLADFVMPFFLFIVGFSVALVFKKQSNRQGVTRKVFARTINLFILGVILQGGYFHGRGNLTYGIDLDRIRLLGVLQRIAIGYFIAALSEIWLVKNMLVDSTATFMRKFFLQWIVAATLVAIYMALLYGLYVPDWRFEIMNSPTVSIPMHAAEYENVHCGVRGSISPPCNVVGLVDRLILGSKHLYQRPVYRRTKECSINSPDYGLLPPNAPGWCLAPFEPEGLLSSVMAVLTCFVGLHFGHLMVHEENHKKIILQWSVTSVVLVLFGYFTKLVGIPFCKALYTFSYMLLTSGASGLLLMVIYYIVDVQHFQRLTVLFQWMGRNALIVFALAASELFPAAIQGFYWLDPKNNLVDLTEKALQTILRSKKWGTMAFTLLTVLFWCLVAGFLHRRGIYIKM